MADRHAQHSQAASSSFAPAPPRDPSGPVGLAALDETNVLILQALSQSGRRSIHDIAQLVNRTESTVRDRVAALERQGILLGYEARIDWARVGLPLQVVIEAHCPPTHALETSRRLHAMPNVVHAVMTTGPLNLIAVFRARDLGDVRKLVAEVSAGALQRIQTRITLEHLVTERPPRPPVAQTRWEPRSQAMAASEPNGGVRPVESRHLESPALHPSHSMQGAMQAAASPAQ